MDIITVNNVVQVLRWHGWIPLLAVVVGGFIRLSKDDKAVAWFPNFIKPENRPLWAIGISILAGAGEEFATGGNMLEALIGGLIAGNTAIAGHEVFSKVGKKIRDKRNSSRPPPPAVPSNDWDDDSTRPPPSTMFPRMMSAGADALVFALWVAVFVAISQIACPGDRVVVRLPTGVEVRVSRDELEALDARATEDAGADSVDGGAE